MKRRQDRKGSRSKQGRTNLPPKRRKFAGNQHSFDQNTEATSKSAEKLQKKKDSSFDVNCEITSSYCILNFFLVFSALQQYVKCKNCDGNLSFSQYGQRGIGFKLCVSCDNCGCKYIDSSPAMTNGYEINRRFVFVMRLLGIGLRGIHLFCGLMTLGNSFSINSYYNIVEHISIAAKSVFRVAANRACNEEKRLNVEKGKPENVLSVSGDGSWAKRGFTSLVGIVSLIGLHSGKVLDVNVRTSYCKACGLWKGKENTVEYQSWYDNHKDNCCANHEGSAGKMEVDGVVEMFLRSEELFKVRYGFYIGDGDSKTFKMLLDVHPYGEDFLVKKIECVLHVKKRVYKRAAEGKKALTQKKKR